MPLRIVITTTLNDNLFRAKLLPLVRSRSDVELVVVTDREGPRVERVRWVWPEGPLRLCGRLGSRLLLLLREVLRSRTRLVMAYNVIPHGVFAVAAARLRKRPVYLHLIGGPGDIQFAHNPDVSDNRWVNRSRNPQRIERMAKWAAKHATRLFVPGSRTASFLESLGYDAARIVRLHSTIDPQRFFPGDGVRDLDVIVSAQLLPRKRPLFTLDVLKQVHAARPHARFCWLGDGPLHDEFAAALDRWGLRSALEWTETEDVASFYRRSRAFLLCSISEGLSLACMEAMACGAVPVTTDCGDMAEVVRNEVTGALVPVEAVAETFAAEVLRLLDNPARWRERSVAAAEIIAREHGFDSASKKWRELLSKLGDDLRDATTSGQHP
jgi:glycosyltransferase involved in cell wall biosynthesis